MLVIVMRKLIRNLEFIQNLSLRTKKLNRMFVQIVELDFQMNFYQIMSSQSSCLMTEMLNYTIRFREKDQFVLNAQQKPEPRNIILGITDGSATEVVSGDLKPGDMVVIGDSSQPATSPAQGQRGGGGFGPFGFGGGGRGRGN